MEKPTRLSVEKFVDNSISTRGYVNVNTLVHEYVNSKFSHNDAAKLSSLLKFVTKLVQGREDRVCKSYQKAVWKAYPEASHWNWNVDKPNALSEIYASDAAEAEVIGYGPTYEAAWKAAADKVQKEKTSGAIKASKAREG